MRASSCLRFSLAWLVGATAIGAIGHAAEPAAPVAVATVERLAVPAQIRLPGSVAARRSSSLSAEVDGLVQELLVDEGDLVEAGQVLLRLRAKPTELSLSAESAQLNRARARDQLAVLRERRNAELLASQMVPEDTYDIAAAELRQSKAEIANATAKVALMKDELARHEIRAPYAGVIAAKRTEAGAWVRAGDVVFLLEELGVLRIRFALPQNYYSGVAEGTAVQLQIDALGGTPFPARVSRKVAVGSEAARTFPVLIDLPNPDHRMAPGMSVDVTLDVGGGENTEVAAVPADAIVMRPDGAQLVWTIQSGESGDVVTPVPIITGRRYRGRVEVVRVLSGELPDGARIVVRGNESLRPGQPVRAVSAD